MLFNVNDEVRVRLTEGGWDVLREKYQHALFEEGYQHLRVEAEENDGWLQFPLWDLMVTFGPHMKIGRPPLMQGYMDLQVPQQHVVAKAAG